MSLIIASNVNLKDAPSTSNIHKPYSWSNRTSNTFKIEKDSEIAVQSVKINKNGQLSIASSNSKYSFYLGEDIDPDTLTLAESVYHPVADSIVRPEEGVKEFTTDELARKVETSMRKNVMNPHFYDAGKVALEVTAKVNATTGAYEGLTWDLQQDAQPSNVVPADGSAQSVFPTSRFTYASGVMTRVNATPPETDGSSPQGCCAVFPDYPCLLSGTHAYPTIDFDISNGTGSDKGTWAVGLTRYNLQNPFIDETTGEISCFCPPYYAPFFNGGAGSIYALKRAFFDFVAIRSADGKLRIYQSCVKTDSISGDRLIMKEVVYYHAGNPVFKGGIYDLATNPNGYTNLRFRIDNQGVICEIGVGGMHSDLVNTTYGDKRNQFTPRSCLQNFLYPQIFIQKLGTSIGIAERNTYFSISNYGSFDATDPDVDWVARLTKTGKYTKWGKPVENRDWNNFDASLGNTKYTFKSAYPYSGGGTSGGWLDETQMNLILAPNSLYGEDYTAESNSQYLLGFKGRSLAIGTFSTSDGSTDLDSISIPLLMSPKSLFVRVNNLTQTSINAQMGNSYSKIIAHLPRFDSAGNEVGALHFEPNQLVYVSLQNSQDLFLNSIDIDLVYDNETYADCLSGKSIVVLHVRKRQY